jgi:hypothetical protein
MDFLKAILLSRGAQLAARGAAYCLTFLAGLFGAQVGVEQIAQSAETIGAILGAGVLFGWDMIVHRVQHGTWLKTIPDARPYNGGLVIAFLLLPGLLGLTGCMQTNVRAKYTQDRIEASAVNYQANVEKLVHALIDDYRDTAIAKADELAAAAIAAETGADGKASAKNLQIIQNKKLEHYAYIERNVITLRSKLIAAAKDMDHVKQYSQAMREYWDKSASTAGILNQSSEQMIGLLEQFVGGKPKKF